MEKIDSEMPSGNVTPVKIKTHYSIEHRQELALRLLRERHSLPEDYLEPLFKQNATQNCAI